MRILVATAGASQSDEAVRLGNIICQMSGGMLTLLTVIKNEAERTQAEAILFRVKTMLLNADVQTLICIGRADEEIVREAESGRYQLVVLGERKSYGLTRRLPPSTAERVIARLPCPVMITWGESRPLCRVLVCEGGRHPSLLSRLIDKLTPLLTQVEEITVLHVMSQIAAAPGVLGWELRADAEELMEKHTPEGSLLENDLARLSRLHVHLEAKVRHGLVVREILAEAAGGKYDLMVIGAHHQSKGWERYLLDDLAHTLINETDRPLLVV